ncbi:MAG TPA: hypothetical protein VKD26_12120 [Streptosporangiaceae bacterium]|nr:hypothetical protein [Streptosporangiaceae bacterium]
MYESLTLDELNALQSMLYDGTQAALIVTNLGLQDPEWFDRYAPVHSEVGHLFLEAGQELADRLEMVQEASAA